MMIIVEPGLVVVIVVAFVVVTGVSAIVRVMDPAGWLLPMIAKLNFSMQRPP